MLFTENQALKQDLRVLYSCLSQFSAPAVPASCWNLAGDSAFKDRQAPIVSRQERHYGWQKGQSNSHEES